jgi:nitroimidazol reductase NimA-like FMN-containing flavoprotein (pyridoxamine 5'-phosphate oxidase superfamily)
MDDAGRRISVSTGCRLPRGGFAPMSTTTSGGLTTMDELTRRATTAIDANRYLVLGTVDDDGRPRVSPVYFTHPDGGDYYWVSSPGSHHSRNISARPLVSFVIFDSSVPPAEGPQAVYVDAEAAEVPEAELAEQCALAFARTRGDDGARAFGPVDVSGDAPIRLYRAVPTRHQVHVRGGDDTYGRGTDHRESVQL